MFQYFSCLKYELFLQGVPHELYSHRQITNFSARGC